jgi:hypothetical protein
LYTIAIEPHSDRNRTHHLRDSGDDAKADGTKKCIFNNSTTF